MRIVHKGQHYPNKVNLSLYIQFKKAEGHLEELRQVYLSKLNRSKSLGSFMSSFVNTLLQNFPMEK